MFSVGDTVLYGASGVCKIKEITEMTVGKVKREYFILVPLQDEKATIYLPTDNERLIGNMHRLLCEAEINELIDSVSLSPMEWVENDLERKERCGEIIKSGDRYELMRLIEMLYTKREELKTSKKHFHISDEKYLREAERLLHDEFSYGLNISKEQVPDYILKRIKK